MPFVIISNNTTKQQTNTMMSDILSKYLQYL